jgi:hypothetical protein
LFPSIVLGRIAGWLADVPVQFSMIPGPYYLEAPILGEIEARTAWADTRVIASCEHTRTLYVRHGVSADRLDLITTVPTSGRSTPRAPTAGACGGNWASPPRRRPSASSLFLSAAA